MELKDLKKLGKIALQPGEIKYSYNGENFDCETIQNALRAGINEIAGTPNLFRANEVQFCELVEEYIDDYIPARVDSLYGQFAEVKQFNDGDKVRFVNRVTNASKKRAKRFVTKVGDAGVYEVFRLDGKTIDVKTTAIGGAGYVSFEDFLEGNCTIAEVLDILLEGIDEMIYEEISKALIAMINDLPRANKVVSNAFDEQEFDRLLSIAGTNASVYCTEEFAQTVVPATSAAWSDAMKQTYFENGYFIKYKNHNIHVLPNGYEDETNTVKQIDPSYAWIIPGGKEKVVKIAFEGDTHVRNVEREDWSKEVQVYKKIGVAVIAESDICVYQNTSLKKEIDIDTSI